MYGVFVSFSNTKSIPTKRKISFGQQLIKPTAPTELDNKDIQHSSSAPAVAPLCHPAFTLCGRVALPDFQRPKMKNECVCNGWGS